jgi:hypothetical protein
MLLYCKNDEEVPFENSITAYNEFQSRGAPQVQLRNLGDSLGHVECASPAIFVAKNFIDSITTASGEDSSATATLRRTPAQSYRLGPNPAEDYTSLYIPATMRDKPLEWRLINTAGQTLRSGYKLEPGRKLRLELAQLPKGAYLLQVQQKDTIRHLRLLH